MWGDESNKASKYTYMYKNIKEGLSVKIYKIIKLFKDLHHENKVST